MKTNKDSKEFSLFVKLMFPYILENKFKILIVTSLILLTNFLLLSVPLYTSAAIDSLLLNSIDYSVLKRACLVITGYTLIASIFEFIRDFIMVRVAQRIIKNLRRDVFAHLLKLKVAFVEDTSRGDILNRISIDIEQISNIISNDIIQIITGFVTVIGSLAMMLYTSPHLTSIYIFIIPILFFVARQISKHAKARYKSSKRDMGIMSGYVEEMFAADKTVKMFALEDKNIKSFDELSQTYQKSAEKAETYSGLMMPASNSVNNLGFILVALLGCMFVINGSLTVGAISAFVIYSKKFTGPIVETANIYSTFQSALSSCERILYILSQETEPTGENAEFKLNGEFKFENVSFSYTPEKQILNNINFEVKPGEKVAIVGATGSGKTTLISLLMRFYDASSGKILVDGKDITSYDLDALRKNIGLVLQENFLFDMSILDNIDYGINSNDREKIISAIAEVSMDKYIESLEKSYDTPLSYENTEISGGQIQLLVIARAMLLDPSIYIFDEATSNVDVVTEQKIKAVTNKIMEGKTAFIIAHRLSTITNCDKIIVLDNGNILEMGSHDELMNLKGRYYKLITA